jgi:hypothetical protein
VVRRAGHDIRRALDEAEIHWCAEHLERARASEAVRAERSKKSECTPGRWVVPAFQ